MRTGRTRFEWYKSLRRVEPRRIHPSPYNPGNLGSQKRKNKEKYKLKTFINISPGSRVGMWLQRRQPTTRGNREDTNLHCLAQQSTGVKIMAGKIYLWTTDVHHILRKLAFIYSK